MNFHSNRSLSNKNSIILPFTDRAVLLSHEKYQSENLNSVKKTFIKNGYPLDLLNEKIANRYKFLMSNKYLNKITNEITETKKF